uniref:Uncharacterized protein n=1 Tax=Chromera velia CCMP2878 TaxID=1169474 RepID=A0A0G4HVC2_9ALVE|eukprot:Cvel_32102.t1-p1 / transcript=Cvel_32102.t1 / gene=Cvel_32102 / organism=Chromera_velia_CCMP2878 / gene_product=hypothetical protein / transcript_product=hypothetical protein / location=Cvel_scaffold4915:1740-2423(-) / protein_length=228 / sequence_SO=supercontig / SO=protein_coding / is_pseudo=false
MLNQWDDDVKPLIQSRKEAPAAAACIPNSVDVDSFQFLLSSWTPIFHLIAKNAVALWPLSVLRFLLDKHHPVPRRQDTPAVLHTLGMREAEVKSAMEGATRLVDPECPPLMGDYTLVCLSYGWLSKEHPDPDLFHLRLLVEELEQQWWAQGKRRERVFVFWDYMAIPQNSRGFSRELTPDAAVAGTSQFSSLPFQPHQQSEKDLLELFKLAISNLDLFYGSPQTRVFR